MKTRQEAVELIRRQLESPTGICGRDRTVVSGRHKCAWHYGKQELRELLDLIYEGEPKTEEERI